MNFGIARVFSVLAAALASIAAAEDRPVALMGFGTDLKAIEADVMNPGRYVYETHCGGWIEPADYGRYSVVYFGEKIDGKAKFVTRCLKHWSERRVGQTAAVPSTGHWGDIGYCLLREYPDRAELSLVQYDYFTPKPLPAGAAPNPEWQAIVRDNAGKRCTFVSRQV